MIVSGGRHDQGKHASARARLHIVNRLAHQRAQRYYRDAKASLLAQLADEEANGRGADLVERWRVLLSSK